MSVQYTRGVQYNGGCSVHWGDNMSTVGGYYEYTEYTGGFSTLGDIMSTPGGIS